MIELTLRLYYGQTYVYDPLLGNATVLGVIRANSRYYANSTAAGNGEYYHERPAGKVHFLTMPDPPDPSLPDEYANEKVTIIYKL